MDTYEEPATTPADESAAEFDDAGDANTANVADDVAGEADVADGRTLQQAADRDGAFPIAVRQVDAPMGWSDLQTGTDGPRLWDRLILSESARVRRYKRPATVVLVELVGLPGLAGLWGAKVAEHALAATARTLSKEIRTSDHIARIEPARFGLLLTETNEIAAINFVERARAACERDVQVASKAVGVAFGWASPPKGGDLSDALGLASARLADELEEFAVLEAGERT